MGGTRFIVAGRFIDGSGADVRRNVFLAVKDGMITAIGSAADLPWSGAAVIDDFSHCTIVPALVDCSVSLSRSPSMDGRVRLSAEEVGFAEKAAMLEQHIRYCHAHGVLGVADSDESALVVERYQEGVAQGSIFDIRTSGRLCRSRHSAAGNSPGGDFLKLGYSGNIEDEQNPYPRRIPQGQPKGSVQSEGGVSGGAHKSRCLADSLIGLSRPAVQLSLNHEDLRRILLHRGAKKAVVVANGRQQVEEALEAGCDAIEQGYGMGTDNLRKMAEKDVLWIPSLVRTKNALDGASSGGDVCCRFSQRYVAPGKPVPGAKAFWEKMLAEQLTQLRFAGKLGVTTAVGTGAGSVGILHGESMVEEMKLFIKAGYSLEETIRCASENGAAFFGMEKLGALTVGRQATFLITRGTVKQLPRKLSYLEGIYVDGAPSSAYSKNPVITAG